MGKIGSKLGKLGKLGKTKDSTQTGIEQPLFNTDNTKGTGTVEIPSITKLLGRKTLNNTKTSTSQTTRPTKSSSTTSTTRPPGRPSLTATVAAPPPVPKPSPQKTPDPIPAEVPLANDPTDLSITGLKAGPPNTATDISRSREPNPSVVPESPPHVNPSRASDVTSPTAPMSPITLEPPPTVHAKVQRATRRGDRPTPTKLVLWDVNELKAQKDPLGQGLAILFAKGALSAAFLSIAPPRAGMSVPEFICTAAVQPGNKINFWTGLKWDPTVVPDTWNYFVKAGFIELAPPGTLTDQKSNRNVIRAAFGVSQPEWLLLIRIGPPNGCRGVLGVLSHKSLINVISEALPLLNAPNPSELPKAG